MVMNLKEYFTNIYMINLFFIELPTHWISVINVHFIYRIFNTTILCIALVFQFS